jgi:subtilisin family serine protease
MRTVPPRSILALLVAVTAAFAAPSVASAANGQIIVKYAAGADAQDRSAARDDASVIRSGALPLAQTELVTPERGTSVNEAIADLQRSADVAYAEPDQPRSAFATTTPLTPPPTNDPDFGDQWALQNTGTQQIWSGSSWYLGTPGDDIDVTPVWQSLGTEAAPTVAVVDSGIDLEHPDLKANILSSGKDFVDGDDVPADQNGHGTHVAGTIGAVGNNSTGVTGVAWKAHLLPIRVLNASGSGSVSNVIKGYQYAAAAGAKVVNLSLGGASPSQAEYDAIRAASSTLFVAAAGNDGANVDTTDSYPCAYDLPNVLCVAATGGRDELASFSNYGANSVDIAAPGVDILSTYPTTMRTSELPGYEWLSGTSMATPEVSGAAALVLTQHPELTPWQVRAMLMAGADQVPGLQGKVASGGRLDVYGAMNAAAPAVQAQPMAATEAPAPRTVTTTAPPTTPTTPAPPSTPATPAPATPTPAHTTPTTVQQPTADRTAPSVAPALAGRHALAKLLAGRLRASVTTSERATVRFELRLDGRTAKRLHLSKSSTAAVSIGTAGATLTQAGTKAATLRLTSAAKRALARLRTVKVALRATATDAAGNARTRSITVTVSR